MFFRARFYSPAVGRFISADTIVPGAGNPQAWNRYSYSLNNPVKYTDPTGHRADDGCGFEGCATDENWASTHVQNLVEAIDFYDPTDNPEAQLTVNWYLWTLEHYTPEAGPMTLTAAWLDAKRATMTFIEGHDGRSAAEVLSMQRTYGTLLDFAILAAATGATQRITERLINS